MVAMEISVILEHVAKLPSFSQKWYQYVEGISQSPEPASFWVIAPGLRLEPLNNFPELWVLKAEAHK